MAARPLHALQQRLMANAGRSPATKPDLAGEGEIPDPEGEEERAAAEAAREAAPNVDPPGEDDPEQRGRRAAIREVAQNYGWTDKETFVKSGRPEAEWRDEAQFLRIEAVEPEVVPPTLRRRTAWPVKRPGVKSTGPQRRATLTA